jgi:hypothetical protein
LQRNHLVARIAWRDANGTREITVSGRLEGPEVRRLETACGPALEQAQIRLHLRIARVTAMDDAARALIARLLERGGTVTARRGLLESADEMTPR